ncbi:lantibiotic dehydratase C-terminal domain-containing protein, partial [Streptomyces bambusae]|uniref:lantibiotic dehydratase C-terminal domain-containing protein n=1 Tax=Streptomyces bambusae TaxID=1550616 RepID=UPI0027DF01E7
MTPPAPPPPPSGLDAGPGQDWLYYRIFGEEYEDLHPLIDTTVRRIVTAARTLNPDGRWFFLRFVDEHGLHVRLRHHGPLDAIAALEEAADRILTGRPEAHPTAPLTPPTRPPRGVRGHAKGLYEPEYAKFAGPAGVRRAERAFQASSEFALEVIGPDFPALRLGHALDTMLGALALLPAARHASFLHHMTWYWTGRNGEQPRRLRAGVAAAAHRAAARA